MVLQELAEHQVLQVQVVLQELAEHQVVQVQVVHQATPALRATPPEEGNFKGQ